MLAVLAFATPADAKPHTPAKPNCERPYKLGLFKAQLRRSFSRKRWKDPTPVKPRERRKLRHYKRCARTPWHARRMRQLERQARKAHRKRRRERKREIRETRCGSPACNIKLAAAKVPVSTSEHSCRLALYHHESGWEETARNPSSGAYGIPQALPASKMGSKALGSGWRAALAQLKWGYAYVHARYGGYCAAWAFWQRNRWY